MGSNVQVKVRLLRFFPRFYQDEETVGLTVEILCPPEQGTTGLRFSFGSFLAGNYRRCRFGKAETEIVAEAVLIVCAFMGQIGGVAKEDLCRFLESQNDGTQDYIADLIRLEGLREEKVCGTAVLFPTRALLKAHEDVGEYPRNGVDSKALPPLGFFR